MRFGRLKGEVSLAVRLRSLIEPPIEAGGALRRSIRMIAWLQAVLVILATLAFVLTLAVNRPGAPRRWEYSLLIAGELLLLVGAILLNHRGHHRASAWLTVLAAFVGPWGSIAIDPQILHGDFVPLVYTSLSVLLCSLVLPVGVTASLALVQMLALGALSVLDPALSGYNWPSLLSYVFFLSALSILVSVINQADMHLIDRQTTQLSESASQLQAILDHSTAVIYIKDIQGRYILINRFFEKVFGHPREEVIGQTAQELFPPKLADIYCQNDQKVIRLRKPLEVEEPVQQTASTYTFYSVKFPLFNAAGEIYAICNISTDITVRKQAEEMLREQSVRDPLTNLFNRRYMEETLEREIHRARRNRKSIGLILADIDHFKLINDTYGHPAGDQVLRTLGEFFNSRIRGGDIACRYGGEEFVLILPETTLANTRERAEEIRLGVRQLSLVYKNLILDTLTISLGVACFPEDGANAEEIMQAVDQALYHAKATGRDRVALATDRDDPQRGHPTA